MRNFAKITAKFRLIQRKFAGASTKFRGEFSANFAFISFVQYCKFNLGDDVFGTIRTQMVSIDLLKNIENQIILNLQSDESARGHMEKKEVGRYDVDDQHLLLYTLTALLSL